MSSITYITKKLIPILLAISAVLFSVPAQAAPADQMPVSVTVTVLGEKNSPAPAIPQEDVVVHSGNKVLKITGWQPAQGNTPAGQLQLAILIDDNLGTTLVSQQLAELRDFISLQAPGTLVGVFYAQHGSAYAAAPFTTDHAQAAQALRLTLGRAGESPSLYLSLEDLAKHWPAQSAARREVLMIGSGNDPLNPGYVDPYLDNAIQQVQKAGLNVHALTVSSLRASVSFRGEVSQGKMIQVAENSGGQSFGDELSAPVSLAPSLNELNRALENQYVLTVLIDCSKSRKGELRPIEVRTEEREVKIVAPHQVFVPGP
jgi:hypothetical protein